MTDSNQRARVEEHLAEVVDGTAPEELYDLVAEDDALRDLCHDAQRVVEQVREAGADYEPPEELARRVLERLSPTQPTHGSPPPADSPSAARVLAFIKQRKRWVLGALGLAAAAALAATFVPTKPLPGGVGQRSEPTAPSWQGTVRHVHTQGREGSLEICSQGDRVCAPAGPGALVPVGAVLRTDLKTRAHIALRDGTEITLDRLSTLSLDPAEGRHARLESGGIVADVAEAAGAPARFDLAVGHLEVIGTKFALRADGSAATVDVSRGGVRLSDPRGSNVVVRAGEQGRLLAGEPPSTAANVSLDESMAWSDTALGEEEPNVAARGLGELRAKKPGEPLEQAGAVSLTSHSVKVRISGAVARTEVDETFTNTTNEVLEGIYRFPLPPDAKIERLALEVDGRLEEGAFVDRDRAQAIWRGSIVNAAPHLRREMREEIIWVPGPWRDPALLEWQRGSRFELRIYPIPRQGSRRIVLAYTQVIRPTAGVRRYTYPLAYDPGGSTRVGRFTLDLQLRGHDKAFGVKSLGYPLSPRALDSVGSVTLDEANFVPGGDLTVEYALPDRDSELTAWAYQPDSPPALSPRPSGAQGPASGLDVHSDRKFGGEADDGYPYVALALRPKLPRFREEQARAFVIAVDASRSMFGESYRRASLLASRVVRELDREDRFTILACDTECRRLPGGMQTPSRQAALDAQAFLATVTPEGGSDLALTLQQAYELLGEAGGRSLRIVYLGDGTPTVGPVRPSLLTQAVRSAASDERARLIAVAVGSDSDLDSLRALARGASGVVLPFVPGQTVAEAAYATLGAAYGRSLTEVMVELPAGLVEAAPESVDTIAEGDEAIIVARMTRRQLEGSVTVRGKLGREAFEQRYPVRLLAATGPSNAFVPRLYAANRIADLEQTADASAKARAVELSQRWNVASRYTSLLVLESEAMFRAFGLDNTRRAPEWSGEGDTADTVSDGEIAYGADSEAADLGEQASGGPVRPGNVTSGLGAGPGSPWGAKARARTSPFPGQAGGAAPAAEATPRDDVLVPPRPAPFPDESAVIVPPSTPPVWQERRQWVPMRRVWERRGEVLSSRTIPAAASVSKIAEAEQVLAQNQNQRSAVRRLYILYALSGDVHRASDLAERWSEKEPLDPEALTARADLAARQGRRDLAIRILGSVVDVRPGDIQSQQRLARLHRWAGRPALGCRHSIAIAELRPKAELLAEAVRCSRETGTALVADHLLNAAEAQLRKAVDALLSKGREDTDLTGDLRLEATWAGMGQDLDLALLHPDGHRVSWLGAPTRAVITATDVVSTQREGLALRGAQPGEYVIEVVRGAGQGTVTGTIKVTAAGTVREVPFVLAGARASVGTARITLTSRLAPL